MKNQHERYQFHMHYHLNLRPRPATHVPATSLLRLEASAANSYEIFIIFSFSWIVTSSSFSSSGLRARLGSTFCMLGAQTTQARDKQETKCLIISDMLSALTRQRSFLPPKSEIDAFIVVISTVCMWLHKNNRLSLLTLQYCLIFWWHKKTKWLKKCSMIKGATVLNCETGVVEVPLSFRPEIPSSKWRFLMT